MIKFRSFFFFFFVEKPASKLGAELSFNDNFRMNVDKNENVDYLALTPGRCELSLFPFGGVLFPFYSHFTLSLLYYANGFTFNFTDFQYLMILVDSKHTNSLKKYRVYMNK